MTGASLLAASLLSWFSMELVSDGSGFYETPDSVWVVPGTVTAVWGIDTLNAASAASGSRTGIRFSPVPPAGDTLLLEFDTMHLSITASPSLDVAFMEEGILEDLFPRNSTVLEGSQGLYISGSKRIGFSVGDGGGLDQGTRITVEGTAAPGITVSGSVTDRNLGTVSSSELVSQLDRIFFIVEGERWRTRLGDMEWISGNGETGPLSWRRELSGIDGRAEPAGGYHAGAGYGTSGDNARRTVFYTSEGVQGPYEVSSGWEIVPGSERVWLDGQMLERGATADYVMEYAAGLITFSAGRLIRRDQRVEITFFQRGDGFRKDYLTFFGSLEGEAFEGLELTVTGLQGRDDRNSPLGFTLTEEAEDVLRNAGEDPAEAWIHGATSVGQGNGSYTLDSLGHWVYQGPGQGDWSVVFGRPPGGEGDYIYDSSLGGYLWAGEGNGSHLPRQYLQIPAGYRTGGLSASLTSGDLDMTLETAVSDRTGNLFNSGETTRGGTYAAVSAGTGLWEGGPGILISGRVVTSGYRSPSRLEADSSLAAWSLPASYSGNDEIVQMKLGGEPLLLDVAGRYLEDGGDLARYGAVSELALAGIGIETRTGYIRRNGTQTLAEGDRYGLDLEAAALSGMFRPFAGGGYWREDWADSLSGDTRAAFAGTGLFSELSSGELRLEFQRDTRSYPSGPFNVWRGRLQGRFPLASMRCSGSLEHSSTVYDMGGQLQADAIRITLTGSSGGTWSETVYSGSGTVSRSLDIIYIYEGPGEGDYSYDPETGEYYPDPDGDYVVSYQSGTQGEKVTSGSLETTLSHSSGSWGLGSRLRISSSFPDDRARSLLLYGAFDRSGEGGYNLELSPWFTWDEGVLRRISFTGRLKDERISYSGSGLREERSWFLRTSPRLRAAASLVIDGAASVWQTREDLYLPREIRGYRLEADPSLELSAGFIPGLLVGWEYRREQINGLSARLMEIEPHVSFVGGGWTSSARASAGYIPDSENLPAWFFDGMDGGVSWRITGRVGRSLASGLDISLFYWGRRPAGSSWEQRAGLEGTVNF